MTGGKNRIRDMLLNEAPSAFTRVEIGNDDTAAAVTQTALQGGTTYGEDGATETEPSVTSVMFAINVAAGEATDATYKEVGLLTGAAGTMLSRQVFTDTVKDATIAFNVDVVLRVKS